MRPVHLRRNAGFTLIEVLMVITIITLLALLLVVGMSNTRLKAEIESTDAFIRSLTEACRLYEEVMGSFPPDNDASLNSDGAAGDPVNQAACLYHYLGTELTKTFADGRTDTVGPFFSKDGIPPDFVDEAAGDFVVDAWGQPIRFISVASDGDTNASNSHDRSRTHRDESDVTADAIRYLNHEESVDIWSIGPDGLDGRAASAAPEDARDDVVNWDR